MIPSLSHLIVTDPSIYASQEQSPPISRPSPPLGIRIQLEMYLKFLLVAASFPTTLMTNRNTSVHIFSISSFA